MYIKEKLVLRKLAWYLRREIHKTVVASPFTVPSNYPFCHYSYSKRGLQSC